MEQKHFRDALEKFGLYVGTNEDLEILEEMINGCIEEREEKFIYRNDDLEIDIENGLLGECEFDFEDYAEEDIEILKYAKDMMINIVIYLNSQEWIIFIYPKYFNENHQKIKSVLNKYKKNGIIK